MSVQNFLPVLSLLYSQLYMCEPKAGELDDIRDTEYIGVMQKNRWRSSVYLIEEERNYNNLQLASEEETKYNLKKTGIFNL